MEVICLDTEAFHSLLEEVVKRLKGEDEGPGDKWIQTEDAMRMLGVKSKTTMQNLRDEGKIRFAQPQKGSSFMIGILSMNI